LHEKEMEIFKMIFKKIKKFNKKKIKFPIYFWGSVNKDGCFIPLAFSFSNLMNGNYLSKCTSLVIKTINEVYGKNKDLGNKTPIIMCDCGSIEKKMLQILNLDFIL